MLTMYQGCRSRSMSGGHDLLAEDLPPFLEALVAGKHGGGVLVAAW
jgi:hypothetical protein